MTYDQAVSFLCNKVPMFQNIGKVAYKADLTGIQSLCTTLNSPQTQFKSIHIAGTNGKGTVCHLLASILQEAGYKTGLYTSPHLTDFRERIRINGKKIKKDVVQQFINHVFPNPASIENEQVYSFFEITTAMAFNYFASQKVDVAVIETGLGGRLDCTNVITPELSIITNIGFDHTDILGDTLSKIATEKAGIIKPNVPIVIGEQQKKTDAVFAQTAEQMKADLYCAEAAPQAVAMAKQLACFLPQSPHIKKNLTTVCKGVEVLRFCQWNISGSAVLNGCKNLQQNTGFAGRWEVVQHYPTIIFDVAHNESGLSKTVHFLRQQDCARLHLIYGTVRDKNVEAIISLFMQLPHAAFYLCCPTIERGMPVEELSPLFEKADLSYTTHSTPQLAYQRAIQEATKEDMVLITGSNFVVAEVFLP